MSTRTSILENHGFAMRQTTVQLMRLVPRNALGKARVLPTLAHTRSQDSGTVLTHLMGQREEAGEAWPKNIRLEPVLKKEAFKRVHADIRNRLKRLMRET
ncbi:hypothetical protein AX14_010115 [Amanita brunnescens Koide BX004]|nr:hypothetical protein AX14_010115 [Amanita brunnescens Koide BX004]